MKHTGLVRSVLGVVAVAGLLATACKTIVEEMPSGPTNNGPQP